MHRAGERGGRGERVARVAAGGAAGAAQRYATASAHALQPHRYHHTGNRNRTRCLDPAPIVRRNLSAALASDRTYIFGIEKSRSLPLVTRPTLMRLVKVIFISCYSKRDLCSSEMNV